MENLKNKVQPIYEELQSYLSQYPLAKDPSDITNDETVWNQLNHVIDKLNELAPSDYERFKILPKNENFDGSSSYIRVAEYRQKLGGLISKLHAEFFSDDPAPFSGSPNTIISQNQTQNQSQTITAVLLETQSLIDKKLEVVEDDNEKGFLEKLKKQLPGIKDGIELVKVILDLGHQYGLDPSKLKDLFS